MVGSALVAPEPDFSTTLSISGGWEKASDNGTSWASRWRTSSTSLATSLLGTRAAVGGKIEAAAVAALISASSLCCCLITLECISTESRSLPVSFSVVNVAAAMEVGVWQFRTLVAQDVVPNTTSTEEGANDVTMGSRAACDGLAGVLPDEGVMDETPVAGDLLAASTFCVFCITLTQVLSGTT